MDRKTSLLNTKKWYDYIINKLHMKNKVCARDYYYIELDCDGNRTQCKLRKREKERTCKLNVRYHIVTLSIHGEGLKKDFNHRNTIVIDNVRKEYERFEPNGHMPYDAIIDNIMENDFRGDFALKDYRYIPSIDFCPRVGPQQMLKGTKLINSCVIWSLWYIEQRLTNLDETRKDIIEKVVSKDSKFATKIVEDYIEKLNEMDILVNVNLQLTSYREHKKEKGL